VQGASANLLKTVRGDALEPHNPALRAAAATITSQACRKPVCHVRSAESHLRARNRRRRLVTLGVAYAVLSVVQFTGHTWFVFRKPVVQLSKQKLRTGGIVGLVIAAVAVLVGVTWLHGGPIVGGNVGRGIWLAFTASCVIGAVVLRIRRRGGRGSSPLS
jgi:hypothetical protein